jgi:hypothetical protein
VDVACGSCGTGLRESAKFCDECGAPTTAVSGETAQYKQVTVLFADVVRLMGHRGGGGYRAAARDHGRVWCAGAHSRTSGVKYVSDLR